MKYLDLVALHEVNVALNFDKDDSSIIGGCDLYTTKAAGSDKKLYKRIERTLEDRHRELLSTVANMSAASAAQFSESLNLARHTPFGSFSETSNRHTFAYLIATLNATHYDYDFANKLNPDEFRRENRQTFTSVIDERMYYARPHIYSSGLPAGATTPLGSPIWGPRSWQLLDSEIDMNACEYYSWIPSDDPFSDDHVPIWSLHYFLYNKERKRVCYFYLRSIGAATSSPPIYRPSLMSRVKQTEYSEYESNPNAGSRKRAQYWLGEDRAKRSLQYYGESDELDNMVIDHPGEVVDAEEIEDIREREESLEVDYYGSEDDSDVESLRERRSSLGRSWSEHAMDRMEV